MEGGSSSKKREVTLPDKVVRRILTMSDEEFAVLSVTKLAVHFGVDRFKLSRKFHKQKNMKLEDFIYKEKMFRAAFLLLAYRDMTVKEVAERIGYCTCDYFIRKFREYYGIVPGKFKSFKTQRSGLQDRRVGLKDRRQKSNKSQIPEGDDRRNGTKTRRNGRTDRRKQNNLEIHKSKDLSDLHAADLPDNPTGDENPCESCKHRPKLEMLLRNAEGPT